MAGEGLFAVGAGWLAFGRSWFPFWVCAAALAYAVAWLMVWLAPRLSWFDHPTQRSSHDQPTPTAGGLGMVMAILLYPALFWGEKPWGWLLLASGMLLAATGWHDDWRPLPVAWRFAVQLLALLGGLASVAWALTERGIAPWQEWPLAPLVIFGLGLVLAGVWWVNLFNFMDGIDALAAQQAVFLSAAGAGLVLAFAPEAVADPWWGWVTIIAAAATGFLAINWPPARIFMGDVASTFLPWALFLWAVYWVVQQGLPLASALVLPLLFVTDATVTLLVRWRQGARVTAAHRSHLYQRLARAWGGTANGKVGHRRVSRTAFLINCLLIAPAAWWVGQLPAAFGVAAAIALYGVAAFLVWRAGAGVDDPPASA